MCFVTKIGAHGKVVLVTGAAPNGAWLPASAGPIIGGALAIAVFGALLADQATFVQGLCSSLLIAGVLATLAAAASLLLQIRQRSASA